MRSARCAATIAVLLAAILSVACTPAPERRTLGTIIDDQSAEVKVLDAIYARPEFGENDHVKVEAHNETLLLAGEVGSEKNKALAGQVAAGIKSVSRVVNELQVMPAADLSGRLHNSWITAKVNSKLTAENPVEGFDAGRIKVMTANRTVFLMGTVSRAQGNAVADVVRDTRGVKKVVKVFDYVD